MSALPPVTQETISASAHHNLRAELRALAKHTSVYGLGNLLSKVVGFVLIPFYTHFLTPADYGTLELLDLSITVFGLVTMMWMNASVVRYYYEYDEEKSRQEFVSTVLIAASVLGVVAAVSGILFSKELSTLVLKSPAFYRYFWLVFLTFGFSTLNSVSLSLLRAKQRSGVVTALSVVSMVLSLSLNIYFIAVLRFGVAGILLSSLITTALSGIALTVFNFRGLKLRFSFEKFTAVAHFGAPLLVTSFASFALNFSDRFFLQHFTNVSAVGIYALGYKFGFMLSFLAVQPFDMIWSSRVYEVAKKPNGPALFSRIFRYYTLLLIALALGLSLFIQDAISIVASPAFRAAYKVVPVVALAYVFQGAYRFFVGGIYVKKVTRWVGAISAVSLALNLALNYVLIRPYGGMGAAWATVISFLVMAGLAYLVSDRLYPVPYPVGPFLAALVVAVILYMGATMLPVSSVILSVGIKVLVLASFPVVLYLTGYFEKSEVERVRQTAQSLWAAHGWGAVGSSE